MGWKPRIEPRKRYYYCHLLPGMQEDTDSEEVDWQLCGHFCFEINLRRSLIFEGERANFSYRLWFYQSWERCWGQVGQVIVMIQLRCAGSWLWEIKTASHKKTGLFKLEFNDRRSWGWNGGYLWVMLLFSHKIMGFFSALIWIWVLWVEIGLPSQGRGGLSCLPLAYTL